MPFSKALSSMGHHDGSSPPAGEKISVWGGEQRDLLSLRSLTEGLTDTQGRSGGGGVDDTSEDVALTGPAGFVSPFSLNVIPSVIWFCNEAGMIEKFCERLHF